jgi:hypothetical protein
VGKSAKASPAPDPTKLAEAQGAANKEAVEASARVNRINEVTPYGNLTYRKTSATPENAFNQFTATGDLGNVLAEYKAKNLGAQTIDGFRDFVSSNNFNQKSDFLQKIGNFKPSDADTYERVVELPEQSQNALDSQQNLAAILSRIAEMRGEEVGRLTDNAFTLDGIPELPKDFSADRKRVEDAVYGRATRMLQPQFDTAERRMRTDLDVRGIPIGGEARNDVETNFARGRDEAFMDAADRAVLAGGQEESRLFGLAQQARQQAIQDRVLVRQQPMNELAALLQGAPALVQPNVTPQAQYNVAPVDVAGSYGPAQAAAAQRAQAASAGNSAIAGLAGAGMTAAAIF